MANRLVAWAIIATAGACVAPLASAEAFWAARGPRGGVAFGGPAAGAFIRPPVVAGHYYAGGCLRCAPMYAPGAVAAGVAIGAAAAAAARPVAVEAPPVVVAAPVQAIAAAPAPQRAAAGQPACVAQLSPESRTIYNATRGAMTPASNLKDVVTAQTRALVMSGKVQSSSARNSATSAGECLAQAQ